MGATSPTSRHVNFIFLLRDSIHRQLLLQPLRCITLLWTYVFSLTHTSTHVRFTGPFCEPVRVFICFTISIFFYHLRLTRTHLPKFYASGRIGNPSFTFGRFSNGVSDLDGTVTGIGVIVGVILPELPRLDASVIFGQGHLTGTSSPESFSRGTQYKCYAKPQPHVQPSTSATSIYSACNLVQVLRPTSVLRST